MAKSGLGSYFSVDNKVTVFTDWKPASAFQQSELNPSISFVSQFLLLEVMFLSYYPYEDAGYFDSFVGLSKCVA